MCGTKITTRRIRRNNNAVIYCVTYGAEDVTILRHIFVSPAGCAGCRQECLQGENKWRRGCLRFTAKYLNHDTSQEVSFSQETKSFKHFVVVRLLQRQRMSMVHIRTIGHESVKRPADHKFRAWFHRLWLPVTPGLSSTYERDRIETEGRNSCRTGPQLPASGLPSDGQRANIMYGLKIPLAWLLISARLWSGAF